jgi:hypothetical protein
MSEYSDSDEAKADRLEKQMEEERKKLLSNPRKPLTKVPQPQSQAQRQQQPQQKQQYDPEIWGPNTQQQQQEKPFFGDYDEERELRAKRMPNIYSYGSKKEQIETMYGPGAAEHEQEIIEQYGHIKYRPGLKPVQSTPNFSISDIHIYDSAGKDIVGTFALVVIKPHAQVAPLRVETTERDRKDQDIQKRIIYEIMHGQGLLVIQNLSRPVMKSDIFSVEPDVYHNFFNTTNDLLVYRLFYDGYLDLRDRYFPTARAQEVAKESRREIFNVQQQRREEIPVGSGGRPKSEDTFT